MNRERFADAVRTRLAVARKESYTPEKCLVEAERVMNSVKLLKSYADKEKDNPEIRIVLSNGDLVTILQSAKAWRKVASIIG